MAHIATHPQGADWHEPARVAVVVSRDHGNPVDLGADESADVNLRLYQFFGPLLREFLAWRVSEAGKRSILPIHPVLAAPYTANRTDRSRVDLRGDGVDRLQPVQSWVDVPLRPTEGAHILTAIPVGEYGVEWAQRLLGAAATLRRQWFVFHTVARFGGWARSPRFDPALLRDATFQGANAAWAGRDGLGVLFGVVDTTVREGISSAALAIAMLTAYLVESYDHPAALAGAALESRLPDRLALMLPINVIGPMAFHGLALPLPVVAINPAGGLDLSPACAGFLGQQRGLYCAELADQRADERSLDGRQGAGHGCPVGSRHGQPTSIVQDTGKVLLQLATELTLVREAGGAVVSLDATPASRCTGLVL